MYAALGVDNIESLIQPPADPTPQPIDAGLENSTLLLGQPATAFAQQNHQAHIDAHRSLFLTSVVQQNPAIQAIIIAHVMQHLQFLASQLSQEQIPQEVNQRIAEIQQQMNQVSPQEAQQIQQQIQMILEQFSSPVLAQLTAEFLQSIGQGGEEDPLVAIRAKELELRDKELDLDQQQFEQKQGQRIQEKLLETEIQKQRIQSQKDIADDKLDVAIARLEQQANLKLLELESKLRS
jgi:hypothetical protein